MQDWIHEIQKTINWFQLGLNFIIEATHHEIRTTINCFQLVLQLIIETNQTWFQAGLHSNLLILDVLGNHFWTFWNPGRPRWYQSGDHLVPGFTREGSWASQCRFVSIFDEFRMPEWDTFGELFGILCRLKCQKACLDCRHDFYWFLITEIVDFWCLHLSKTQ